MNTPIRAGALRGLGDDDGLIPFFQIDYGMEYPSLFPFVRQNRSITLDMVPMGDLCTFHIIGSQILTEMTVDTLFRALAVEPQQMRRVLFAGGRPVFSTSVTLDEDSYQPFTEAREALGGYWLLVLLGCDATEVVVAPSGEIESISVSSRARYDNAKNTSH